MMERVLYMYTETMCCYVTYFLENDHASSIHYSKTMRENDTGGPFLRKYGIYLIDEFYSIIKYL